MVRWAQVFFMSNEKTGMTHPCGDGQRKLVVIEREDGSVMALYPPTLEAATYTEEVWRSFRPELETIEHPGPLRVRLLDRITERRGQGIRVDFDETQEVLELLKAMMPPPPAPRMRVRTRPSA